MGRESRCTSPETSPPKDIYRKRVGEELGKVLAGFVGVGANLKVLQGRVIGNFTTLAEVLCSRRGEFSVKWAPPDFLRRHIGNATTTDELEDLLTARIKDWG